MLDYDSDAMREIVNKKLPATVLRALLYLLAHVERGNVLDVGIDQLANECTMTPSQASLALKRLRQERVIVEYKDRRLRMHMLNPAFGWNGPATENPQGWTDWENRLAAQERDKKTPLTVIEA